MFRTVTHQVIQYLEVLQLMLKDARKLPRKQKKKENKRICRKWDAYGATIIAALKHIHNLQTQNLQNKEIITD